MMLISYSSGLFEMPRSGIMWVRLKNTMYFSIGNFVPEAQSLQAMKKGMVIDMLNIDEIQKIIPHRPPMLLIDRIDELKPGEYGVGIKCVSMNEPYFTGHFPNKAVMPGVIILEALAQTGAVVMLSKENNAGKIVYFGGMDKVKFRRQVYPGDVLRLEVKITGSKGNFGIGNATAYVEDKPAVQAILTFAIE
jgi:3-hydroxyacyl-[acyl-carrier-protein] dehydratase